METKAMTIENLRAHRVHSLGSAQWFIRALVALELAYHPDDHADDCLRDAGLDADTLEVIENCMDCAHAQFAMADACIYGYEMDQLRAAGVQLTAEV